MVEPDRWIGWCPDHAGLKWSPKRCELDTCPGSRPFPEMSREYGQAAPTVRLERKIAAPVRDDALEMEM